MMKFKKKYIIPIIFVLIFITIFSFCSVLAKYFYKANDVRVISSSNFYFRSDSDSDVYNGLWNGIDDYKANISILNYDNKLLYTDKDIKYKVSIDKTSGDFSNVDLKISGILNNVVEGDYYVIKGGSPVKSSFLVELIPLNKDISEKYEFSIVFSSVEPYVAEEKINFSVSLEKDKTYIYSVNEYSEYVSLLLNVSKSLKKDLVINYNSSVLIPDKSNSIIDKAVISNDKIIINKDLFSIEKSYEINFIKVGDFSKNSDLKIE